ncbi:hypothetical protein ACOME3_000550 [Neoechinorhynchus agilis]
MSKLITINVGEAGNRIGDAYWRLMCAEHGIRLDGRFRGTNEQLQFVDTLFDTNTYNRLNPRAILLDSDRSPIENILDQGRSLYTADRCIMGNEGGSDNFARLYFSEAAPLLERTLNIIRSDFERNDSIQGFQVIHSAAGGCGAEKSITTLTALPSDVGISIRKDKCKFLRKSVRFMGHILEDGMCKADDQSTKDLLYIRSPTNKQELRSFLGARKGRRSSDATRQHNDKWQEGTINIRTGLNDFIRKRIMDKEETSQKDRDDSRKRTSNEGNIPIEKQDKKEDYHESRNKKTLNGQGTLEEINRDENTNTSKEENSTTWNEQLTPSKKDEPTTRLGRSERKRTETRRSMRDVNYNQCTHESRKFGCQGTKRLNC